MARYADDYTAAVTLSILDRLIDGDPDTSVEAIPTRTQSVRQLKDGLRRDLEWLLNTRRIAVPPDESLKEVNRSLYIFGLPDFTHFGLNSPQDQAKLVRFLQNTVKIFEPRLANVRIVPLETIADLPRCIPVLRGGGPTRCRAQGSPLSHPAGGRVGIAVNLAH